MAQDQEEFQAPYKFKADGVTVVLEHHLEKNLRVSPNNESEVDGDGGFGQFARWQVNIKKDGDTLLATFKNEKTGDYLRIYKDGEKIDGAGKGGKFCDFKVHRISGLVVTLESNVTPGAFVAVNKDGVLVGKGGPLCRFKALKKGAAPKFSKPYQFAKENTVVIEHRDSTTLRIDPKNNIDLLADGGNGEWAQWKAKPSEGGKVVQFESVKTGDYLRIKGDDTVDAAGKGKGLTYFKVHRVDAVNEVRLESQKFEGKFLELDPQNNNFKCGNDKNRKSIFHIYRED